MTSKPCTTNPTPTGKKPIGNAEMIVILGLLAAIGPLSIDTYLPSIPAIADEFNVHASLVQQSVSAYFFGLGFGQLLCGPASDRYGRKIILVLGLVLYLVASLACIRAPSADVLIVARLVQGLGASATAAAGRAIIRDLWSGNRAARALSFVMIVMAFAPMAAPFIGSQMFELWGWRPIFWLMFGFGLLLIALVVIRLPETNGALQRQGIKMRAAFRAYGHILKGLTAWGYLLCGGLSYAVMFAYIVAASGVYIDYFSIKPTIFPFFFALNAFGLTLGNALNTRYVRRFGFRALLGVGLAVIIIGSVGLLVAAVAGVGGFWTMVSLLFLAILPVSMVGSNAMTGLLNIYPRNAGAASALFGVAQFGMGGVAGLLTRLFTTQAPTAMGLSMTIMALGAFIGWGLLRATGEVGSHRIAHD